MNVEEAKRLEVMFNGNVPSDYLMFMKTTNGCDPDISNCLFKYKKYNGRYSAWAVQKFLQVDEIESAINAMQGMLCNDYIPIAMISNGDPIVMLKTTRGHGSLFLYDGDEMDDDNIPKTKLSASFSEFAKSLVHIDEIEIIIANGTSCN